MKIFVSTTLMLLSLSAFASPKEVSFCPKLDNTIPRGEGHELINRSMETKSIPSHLRCNDPDGKNYFYDNGSEFTYNIASSKECGLIEDSIREHLQDTFTFVVDKATGFVYSVKREPGKLHCVTRLEL